MATTTRVPTFKTNLVSLLVAANPTVQILNFWPGPSTKSKGIYLDGSRGRYDYAAISATGQRVRRDEEFEVDFVCASWLTALSPTTSKTAQDLVISYFTMVDTLLAANPELRTTIGDFATRSCDWCRVDAWELETVPFNTGFVCRLNGRIQGSARLT